ncbi:MAG: hypothetical protein ABFD07_20790 [Methanobacterium sp.]
MNTLAIQQSYREWNRYFNWKPDEDGFWRALPCNFFLVLGQSSFS